MSHRPFSPRTVSPLTLAVCLSTSLLAHGQTFNVSDSATLQAALNDAAANSTDDTILLANGTYATSENGGAYVFNDAGGNNLTLQAQAASGAILDGGNLHEVLVIKHALRRGTIVLNGLIVQNGTRGVRIENASADLRHLTLRNHHIDTGLDRQDGAALAVLGNVESVKISDCLFNDNQTINRQLDSHGGAAVLQAASIEVQRSQFIRNQASRYGGALMLTSSRPNTVITDSDFEDNHTGVGNYGFGGAVYINQNLTTRNNLFHRNVAESLGSERSQGGAIFATAFLLSQNDLFSENTASIGGAIRGNAKTDIENGVFRANHATTMGAALMVNSVGGDGFSGIHNSLFIANQGDDSAPDSAVYCFQSCQVVNSLFDGNLGAAALVFANGPQAGRNVVANTVFLNTQGFAVQSLTTYSRVAQVSLFNNYLDLGEVGTPAEYRYGQGNFKTQDAHLDEHYQPMEDSPLRDAGLVSPNDFTLPLSDHQHFARVAGTWVDVGPFEYGSQATETPNVPGGSGDDGTVTPPTGPTQGGTGGDVNFSDAVGGGGAGSTGGVTLLGLALAGLWQRRRTLRRRTRC